MIRRVLILAALAVALATPGLSDSDANDEAEERGRLLYRIYCENCHGKSARGNGPTAKILTVPPADLTRLREEGEVPRDAVREIIDGRDIGPAHGAPTREMPIWGLGLQELDRDVNQEAQVRTKIDDLIAYLESIQRN